MLEIRDLSVFVQTADGEKQVVQHVDLWIPKGQVVGIVGESGSGKSMLCNAIMQLFKDTRRYTGDIVFQGHSLLAKNEEAMRKLRGQDIAMIMQNPMAMFNPIVTIGTHFVETLQAHQKISKREAMAIAATQLARFQLLDARILAKYPHELSGGMLQRTMIALAASLQPKLLIADEPTTALDTITQLDILDELLHYQQQTNTSMLIVSHDLAVIAKMANRIAVMRRGVMIEYGSAECMLVHPVHPYTKALLAARDAQYELAHLIDAWEGKITGELVEHKPGYWVRQEA